jgi:hypothetical protein
MNKAHNTLYKSAKAQRIQLKKTGGGNKLIRG